MFFTNDLDERPAHFKLWSKAKSIVEQCRKHIPNCYSHENKTEELDLGFEDFSFRPHYRLNCSGFLNYSLSSLNFIKSLSEIREYVFKMDDRSCYKDTYYPRALTFVRFMQHPDEKRYWKRIQNVNEMQPGDIIAYATKLDKIRSGGQHVMIVSDHVISTPNPRLVYIPIFDSTSGNPENHYLGHGQYDYRGKHGGIGEGIVGIETDERFEPKKFKWSPEKKSFDATIVIARIHEK